jgi:hypothetical protein
MKRRQLLADYQQMKDQYQQPIEDTLNRLFSLGLDPEHVAGMLISYECKGYRGNACDCPVSRFLAPQFPELRFAVHKDAVLARNPFGVEISVPVVPVLSRFIDTFDNGGFPELTLPGEGQILPEWYVGAE